MPGWRGASRETIWAGTPGAMPGCQYVLNWELDSCTCLGLYVSALPHNCAKVFFHRFWRVDQISDKCITYSTTNTKQYCSWFTIVRTTGMGWGWDMFSRCSSVKPHLGYCSVTHLSRRDAFILRRLRIGHTRVTYKYLLSGDSQPLCDKCQCSLTVKHILLECCSLKHVREKYFTCSSLKELFENVDATTIMDFIKEVNFYHLV